MPHNVTVRQHPRLSSSPLPQEATPCLLHLHAAHCDTRGPVTFLSPRVLSWPFNRPICVAQHIQSSSTSLSCFSPQPLPSPTGGTAHLSRPRAVLSTGFPPLPLSLHLWLLLFVTPAHSPAFLPTWGHPPSFPGSPPASLLSTIAAAQSLLFVLTHPPFSLSFPLSPLRMPNPPFSSHSSSLSLLLPPSPLCQHLQAVGVGAVSAGCHSVGPWQDINRRARSDSRRTATNLKNSTASPRGQCTARHAKRRLSLYFESSGIVQMCILRPSL